MSSCSTVALPALVVSRLSVASSAEKRLPPVSTGSVHAAGVSTTADQPSRGDYDRHTQLIRKMTRLKRENERLVERNNDLSKQLEVSEETVHQLSQQNVKLTKRLKESESALLHQQREAMQLSRERELAQWREIAERDRLLNEATRRSVSAEAEVKLVAERADAAQALVERLSKEISEVRREAEEAEAALRTVSNQRATAFSTQIADVVTQMADISNSRRAMTQMQTQMQSNSITVLEEREPSVPDQTSERKHSFGDHGHRSGADQQVPTVAGTVKELSSRPKRERFLFGSVARPQLVT